MKRRDFLAGAIASLPMAAYSDEMRPPARAGRPAPIATLSDIIARHGLAEKTGFLVLDLASGQVLEAHNPNLSLPPASVTKAITALYAQAHLGNDFRFETRLVASGPIVDGQLQGDLYLVGGADPLLDTDHLAELAQAAASAGIRRISGRFYVVDTALPQINQIETGQPLQAGYNPSISGLNLNFNRVYFEWKKSAGQYNVTMQARALRNRPAVANLQMQVVNRNGPIYGFQQDGDVERWSVARSALGNGGGRWLPVRDSGVYAGAVFKGLAAAFGIDLPVMQKRARIVGGAVIARKFSAPLGEIQRSMLHYSTNITAEILGMRATQATGQNVANLRGSARAMARWAGAQARLGDANFANHSGLSDRSKISSQAMTALLAQNESRQGLSGILNSVPFLDGRGDTVLLPEREVFAKSGTLNFTRGLAGYIESRGQQKLAFAIFSADMALRDAAGSTENPRGARSWSRNAKAQEKALLLRWASALA